jgi:hypothetical protein
MIVDASVVVVLTLTNEMIGATGLMGPRAAFVYGGRDTADGEVDGDDVDDRPSGSMLGRLKEWALTTAL